jgi:hypothetical protein
MADPAGIGGDRILPKATLRFAGQIAVVDDGARVDPNGNGSMRSNFQKPQQNTQPQL